MDLKTASRIFFAITIIAIGVIGITGGGFAPILLPVPETLPGRQLLAFLSAIILLICGAGLLVKRSAAAAALGLLCFLIIWTGAFKFPFIIRAPLEEVSYQSTGENLVLVAAAWILAAEFAGAPKFLVSNTGLRIAHVLYGLALVAFGLSHFVYLQMTAPLVPGWLPGPPTLWAYLTGGIYLVAGLAVLSVMAAHRGTMLAAAQITLITLLVWGPVLLSGQMTAEHWQETVISWALTAGAWVLASGLRPDSKA